VTGPRDPRDDLPQPPDDEPSWPAHDLDPPSDDPNRQQEQRWRPGPEPPEQPPAEPPSSPSGWFDEEADVAARPDGDPEPPDLEDQAPPPSGAESGQMPPDEPPGEPPSDGEPGGSGEPPSDGEPGGSGEPPSDGEPGGSGEPPSDEPPDEEPGVWDVRRFGERRKATLAEQAVPWLVGFLLALAGIVIVLLTLIFTTPNNGVASTSEQSLPTPPPSFEVSAAPASPTPTATPAPSVTASASVVPTPIPTYGALEMLYLSRPSTLGVSELFRRDFSTSVGASAIAGSSTDVTDYAVASDGTVAVAIINRTLLAITPGQANRTLARDVDLAIFGADAGTVYAVQVVTSRSNPMATVYAVNFSSGSRTSLATLTFSQPPTVSRSTLQAARFVDDGGTERLYATSDGNLVFWVSGVGQWRIDPVSGDTLKVTRQPILWSPDGTQRIKVSETGSTSTLTLVDSSGTTLSKVTVSGVLSHLRWSPNGKRVAFTLGVSLGGGIRQDLYDWNLANDKQPTRLTSDGASYGAEWLGVAQFWQP
jgi:hypothetical protein